MIGELQTLTLTIPNDATGYREQVAGRYVKIASATVASVFLQFDNGVLARVWPGDCYPGPADGFKTIRFVSDLGACTVVVHVSPEPITGSNSVTLAALTASLANIDADTTLIHTDLATTIHGDLATTIHGDLATTLHGDLATTLHTDLNTTLHADLATTLHGDLNELKPYTTHVRLPQTLVAQTGVGFTQLVAANALNREVEIVCDMGNAGYVYLAMTNDVTLALSITELQAGGAWNRKWKGNVFACSTNGTEQVRGSVWRE